MGPSTGSGRGPSAVDLPDPLNNSDEALTAIGADDLLSQLAGDEIDRLMRDDRPLPVLELRPPEPENAPVQDAAPVVEAPRAPEAKVAPAAAAEEEIDNPVEEAIRQDVEEVIEEESALARELDEDERIHAVGGVEADDDDARVDEAAIEEAAENVKVQLDQLLAEVDLTPVPFMRESGERAVACSSPSQEIPVYLAPLVWMNAPVMTLPGWARKMLGMISIILFVAGVGALGYVLFLRSTTQF